MNPRAQYELPPAKEAKLKRAAHLEWITIGFLISITIVMYLTMGSSQAMKAAWIEDVLSLIPPIVFLIAVRVRKKAPDERFPYGYHRVVILSFLVAAVSILILGLYLIYDAAHALITRQHPTIGHFTLFGYTWEIWAGWVMIAALIYSMVPPIVLGRMKLPLASELHEKTLHADAAMNKADWLTSGAAILGILGISLGFWWADSVAAGVIAIDVLKDGVTNVKNAIADLMDHRPTSVDSGEPLPVGEHVRAYCLSHAGVRDAQVRLREEGHLFSGEVFVVPSDLPESPAKWLEDLATGASGLDDRLHDLTVTLIENEELDAHSTTASKQGQQE